MSKASCSVFCEVKQLSLSDYRSTAFHPPPPPTSLPSCKNPFWLLFSNEQTGLIVSHACKHCLHTNIGFELHRHNVTANKRQEHAEWEAGASVGINNRMKNCCSVKLNYCNRLSCVVSVSSICWVNCELFRTQVMFFFFCRSYNWSSLLLCSLTSTTSERASYYFH